MAQHLPSPAFNSVVGLRRGQAEHIRPLIEWYRAHGVAVRFELTAGDDDPARGRELGRLGFLPSARHAAPIPEAHLAPSHLDASDLEVPAGGGIPADAVPPA